jgi:hypothetical protein
MLTAQVHRGLLADSGIDLLAQSHQGLLAAVEIPVEPQAVWPSGSIDWNLRRRQRTSRSPAISDASASCSRGCCGS